MYCNSNVLKCKCTKYLDMLKVKMNYIVFYAIEEDKQQTVTLNAQKKHLHDFNSN